MISPVRAPGAHPRPNGSTMGCRGGCWRYRLARLPAAPALPGRHTLNEAPQPQVDLALGLWKMNPLLMSAVS